MELLTPSFKKHPVLFIHFICLGSEQTAVASIFAALQILIRRRRSCEGSKNQNDLCIPYVLVLFVFIFKKEKCFNLKTCIFTFSLTYKAFIKHLFNARHWAEGFGPCKHGRQTRALPPPGIYLMNTEIISNSL